MAAPTPRSAARGGRAAAATASRPLPAVVGIVGLGGLSDERRLGPGHARLVRPERRRLSGAPATAASPTAASTAARLALGSLVRALARHVRRRVVAFMVESLPAGDLVGDLGLGSRAPGAGNRPPLLHT